MWWTKINKQGMIFHMTSAKLTKCALSSHSAFGTDHGYRVGSGSSKHQNIEYFISAPKLKTYQSSDWKKCMFGYSGGPWVAHTLSDWAHLASQLSSHLYQSTYKIWKQSDKDFFKLSWERWNVCGRGWRNDA